MKTLKIVLMGNYSAYPFIDELGIPPQKIKRVTSWNETLAEALASLPNTEVHVISLYIGERTTTVSRGPLSVTYLVVPKTANALTLYGFTAWKARQFIDKIKPDIVHGIGTEHMWPTAALGSKFPCVITVHGVMTNIVKDNYPLLSRQRYFSLLERRIMKKARNFITISPYIQNIVKARNASASFYEVENPVSRRFFEVTSLPSKNKTILFVGHTQKGKGLGTLIKAFTQLKREGLVPGWKISVVGPIIKGNYYDKICRMIKDQQLLLDISFEGFMLPHEIIREYNNAAFLVLPSKQETAPMSVAESMACGLPVVATRVGGVSYMVADGHTGFLCKVDDSEELACQMRKLVQSPALRDSFGAAAKQVAARRWQPEIIAEQTRMVYCKILDRTTQKLVAKNGPIAS
jgi:glycosyltransferase involved in cell wall biosynthesis